MLNISRYDSKYHDKFERIVGFVKCKSKSVRVTGPEEDGPQENPLLGKK